MKILLKKENCESREQCTGPTRPIFSCLKHASQKKKKKNANAESTISKRVLNKEMSLFFSRYTRPKVKDKIQNCQGPSHDYVREIPWFADDWGKSKVGTFKDIKEWIVKRVMGWK